MGHAKSQIWSHVETSSTWPTTALFYPTVDALTADQRLIQAGGRFSFAEGEAELNPHGPGWLYYLEAGAYYDTVPPDDDKLTAATMPPRP